MEPVVNVSKDSHFNGMLKHDRFEVVFTHEHGSKAKNSHNSTKLDTFLHKISTQERKNTKDHQKMLPWLTPLWNVEKW